MQSHHVQTVRPIRKKVVSRKVWKYRKADNDSFRADLKEYHQEFTTATGDCSVEDLWTTFKGKLLYLMGKHIPQKSVKGNQSNKQWVNREVRSAIRKRNKLFTRQKKSHKGQDTRKYKEAKARAQRLQRKAY